MDLVAGEISPMRGPRVSAGAWFGRYRCTVGAQLRFLSDYFRILQ